MAEGVVRLLLEARSRWMIGGEPPRADHPLAAGQTAVEAELRLLAVAGQYLRLRQPPHALALNVRPDLPGLSLPFLPDALRPLARRSLADKADRGALGLATFVARRGYVLHPADWLPPPDADLPEVYRPLQLWQMDRQDQPAPVTAATWLDFTRAERLDHFRRLRATDRAAAQELLEALLAAFPADERLSLVEALGRDLSPQDAAFLEGLSEDRSEKVRKAAVHLLARLGRVDADPKCDDAAAMFELATEGILRRRKVLRLNPKAKDAQIRTLVQGLPGLTLSGLAKALGLTAAQFVDCWQPDKAVPQLQVALSEMIARTAGDAEVAAYWQGLRGQPEATLYALPALFGRLSGADQEAALLGLVEIGGIAASPDVLALAGVVVPAPVSAALTSRRGELAALVRLSQDASPDKAASARADAQRLAGLLSIFGLTLTAEDAALIVRTAMDAGLHPADPMLDRLYLNASLKGP